MVSISSIWKKLINLFMLCNIILVIFATPAYSENGGDDNRVRITVDYNTVFFPEGISRLYFHIDKCVSCKDSIPQWRFFGDLLVDSIMRNGVIENLTDRSQLEGVLINSSDLMQVLIKYDAYTLERSRYSIPYQTEMWSEVRQKYFTIPDQSKNFWFRIKRGGNLSQRIDSIVNILQNVQGITRALPPLIFKSEE